jgi:CHAT domain-containing protein
MSVIVLCLLVGFPVLAVRSESDGREFTARTNLDYKLKPQIYSETSLDTQQDLAAKAFAKAEALRMRWEEASFKEAIEKYEEAALTWRDIAPAQAAKAWRSAGDVYVILSDYKQALNYYQRALEISRKANNQVEALEALNGIGYAYIYLGEGQKALRYITKVNKECRQLPPSIDNSIKRDLEARTLNNMGEAYYALGDLKASLKMYTEALELWTATNDRRGLALAHLDLGYSYTDLGDLQEATEHYLQSLALWKEIGDHQGEALASTALGGIYSFLGDNQQALNSHKEALALFRVIGNRQGAAAAINGVAQAYENLSDYKMALENYQLGLDLYQTINNRDFIALNKYYIGRVYFSMGEREQARSFYLQALSLSREVHDRQIEAHVLKGLGIIDSSEGNNAEALKRFLKVLQLYNTIGYLRGKAYTLNSIGHIYYTLGNPARALACFRQALPIISATEDSRGEALTRYNMASVEYVLGNLNEALSQIKESINIIEASRIKVDSKDLRTSYFAQAYKHYELYIDLLMQIYKQQGAESNYATAAFLASERARARSLLDMLTEEKLNLDQSTPGNLLVREQELAQRLNAKTEYRTRLLSSDHAPVEADEVDKEIRTLSREYEVVQSQIREKNPRYAAITQPDQVRIQDIQAELRNDDTLLLEFSLGNERSYLWAVSPTSINAYELPGRAVIESTVNKVYDLLTARQRLYEGKAPQGREFIESAELDYLREASALSWTLLGPVASQLGSRRLLIVADGPLQYIPFEALPVPNRPADANLQEGSQARPPEPRLLIDDHEVVELPSASILVAIRRDIKQSAASKTVAVLADPVFDKDDPRLHQGGKQESDTVQSQKFDDAYLNRALRTLNGEDSSSTVPRLPGSLQEAKAIMATIPLSEGMMAVGFEATRERVMSEDLKHYRIIHLATHGILDNERPEMSGLIFSLVDSNGNSRSGYLRLKDIYGLHMQADLVVLSACRTGLGQNVQGEGLIGLTGAFMYAGSKGVVASLWKVDDEATAELMKNFYASMLKDGLPPASALRAAKQAMRAKNQWHSPYFWAAFVLHGEYKETFAIQKEERRIWLYAPLLAMPLVAAVLFLLLRRRKRLSG